MQTLIWIIFMGLMDALNHLMNLFAPAAAMAVLLVVGARLFKCDSPSTLLFQWVVQLLMGSAVLAVGLALSGRDGKMLTYAALVVVMASCQWVLVRGWKP